MSTETTHTLAERIAKMIESAPQTNDTSAILAALEKINTRLDVIERSAASNGRAAVRTSHPSLDKLSVAEAIADQLFDGLQKDKACQFEPGKPCDHCSMCNSRGF